MLLHLLNHLVDLLELDAEVVLMEVDACNHRIHGLLLQVDLLLLLLFLRLAVLQAGKQAWEADPWNALSSSPIPCLELAVPQLVVTWLANVNAQE